MSRRELRESLTARIFVLTLAILLAASGVTFGLIAWATPMTYVSVMTDAIEARATELTRELENQTYDNLVGSVADFVSGTGAEVTVTAPDGETLSISVETLYNGIGMGIGVVTEKPTEVSTDDDAQVSIQRAADAPVDAAEGSAAVAEDTAVEYASTSAVSYSFTLLDKQGVYTLTISPSIQPINQAFEALAKVAPWLFLAMLLFSLCCAIGYSRLISRPIVRLSGISQKMAALDFGWEYAENRADEIGMLGRDLNSLSRSLAAAMDELRQANAALERDIARERELEQQRLAFFSAASHELKTPVTILKGQLTGMLEGVDVYQDRDKYLARALGVTGRMEHLVGELLTVSRMETADFDARIKPLDLSRLLGGLLPLYQELAAQKGMTVDAEIPDSLPLAGDEALLRKALDGVLSNAVLYSPAGEAVCVTAARQAGNTVLTIENSGANIPEEALPHLTEAFYRVEQSRNRSTGGSGLGLYLTARILQRYNAAFSIENTAAGVRVTIRFAEAANSIQNT